MQDVVKKTYNLLNTDGMIMFVIGNTEYKGVKIDNVKHFANSSRKAGYQTILASKRKISKKILTPYRDKDGKFTTDANGRSKGFIGTRGCNTPPFRAIFYHHIVGGV
jgi:hypothetical protein